VRCPRQAWIAAARRQRQTQVTLPCLDVCQVCTHQGDSIHRFHNTLCDGGCTERVTETAPSPARFLRWQCPDETSPKDAAGSRT
jgi:hypothetical protein